VAAWNRPLTVSGKPAILRMRQRVPVERAVRREGPDAMRLSAAVDDEGFWPGAPDLVAEVRSPSDRRGAVAEKMATWLGAGTRMVVVIDPRRRTVPVHRADQSVAVLGEADSLDGGDVVPGWTLPVGVLFA
jgi:Uma2 family endonuclease